MVVAQGNGTASPRPRAPTSRKRPAPPGGDAGGGSKGKRDRQRSLTVPTTTASAPLPTTQLPTAQLPTTVNTTSLPANVAALVQQLHLHSQKPTHPVSKAASKAVPLSAAPPAALSTGPPVVASPASAAPISHPALSVPQPQKLSDQIKEVFKIDSHPALKTDEKREAESKPLPPSPPPPIQPSGGGILNDTIAAVSRSINAQHSLLAGPTNDMGFTHYAERVRSLCVCVCVCVCCLRAVPPPPSPADGVCAAGPVGHASKLPQEGSRQC